MAYVTKFRDEHGFNIPQSIFNYKCELWARTCSDDMITSIVTTLWNLFMMTSSNGTIFLVTGPLCGEFTGPDEFPAQRPVTRSFDVFFDLRLNKRLSKQPWGWWFETPPWSLWRHRMVLLLALCHRRFPCSLLFLSHLHLRKQSWGWWFETLSRPLLRHCN